MELMNDIEILKINSPKDRVNGPFRIVYKNVPQKWAIVTLSWQNKPSLGIRWFWSAVGTPNSRGNPTWFIIPSELYVSILNGLPLSIKERKEIEDFLYAKNL